MSGWYELRNNENRQCSFVLKAGNGEVILTSQEYSTHAAAETGMASVRSHCADDAHYAREVAKDGRHYFNLKSSNHQIIGTSQMYKEAASRDKGIESVKTNGGSETVKDLRQLEP